LSGKPLTEAELRRIVQEEMTKTPSPPLGVETEEQKGGVQFLLARVDELRKQAQEKSGWRPGIFIAHTRSRLEERLKEVRPDVPMIIRPLEEKRIEAPAQTSLQQQMKVPIYSCPCGFGSTSREEFEKHKSTAHRSTIRSYG
jgi:hypothetical protein